MKFTKRILKVNVPAGTRQQQYQTVIRDVHGQDHVVLSDIELPVYNEREVVVELEHGPEVMQYDEARMLELANQEFGEGVVVVSMQDIVYEK